MDKKLTFPHQIGNFKVDAIRDLTIGYDSEQPNNIPILAVSKSSQMITFKVSYLDNPSIRAVLTLRTSGTEPKIKYYSEISGSWTERVEIDNILDKLVKSIQDELFQPLKFGFQ